MSAPTEPLTLDQEDFEARLIGDGYLAEVSILSQRKGVTENDILNALAVFNERGGKIGAVLVVLMPELVPDETEGPSARYFVRTVVQVITQPLFNDGDGGTGLSSEVLAERVRQLLHFQSYGRSGTYKFDGMDPLPRPDGQVSYGVRFRRAGGDSYVTKVNRPTISADNDETAPCTVTMACTTVGAVIWYTTDGTYPSSENAAALQYSAPFSQSSGATLRAAAQLSGSQQSDVTQLVIDPDPGAVGDEDQQGEGGEALEGEGGESLKAE